jgi:hypothetical protein
MRPATAHRETCTVHGDALTFLQIVVATANAKFSTRGNRSNALDRTDVIDETGKHYLAPNA